MSRCLVLWAHGLERGKEIQPKPSFRPMRLRQAGVTKISISQETLAGHVGRCSWTAACVAANPVQHELDTLERDDLRGSLPPARSLSLSLLLPSSSSFFFFCYSSSSCRGIVSLYSSVCLFVCLPLDFSLQPTPHPRSGIHCWSR